jgi:hypothetical protein
MNKKPGSAPSLTGTDPKLGAAETGVSLDHIAKKAQGCLSIDHHFDIFCRVSRASPLVITH